MIDRGNGCVSERISARKIFLIPEDRPQRFRHDSVRSLTSDEIPVDPKAFELTVQPFSTANVSASVGEKCTVLELDWSGHASLQNSWQSVSLITQPVRECRE